MIEDTNGCMPLALAQLDLCRIRCPKSDLTCFLRLRPLSAVTVALTMKKLGIHKPKRIQPQVNQ